MQQLDNNAMSTPPEDTLEKPFTAHESRALTMGLEEEYDLPSGALQAINENMTGYRKDNSLLPPHVQRSPSRMAEHIQAAQRFHEKLNEFDGILPLAVDAYYRGDKATKQSLVTGFDKMDVENIYSTLARIPKYGGQEFTEDDYKTMAESFGHAPGDYSGQRNAPIPKPIRPGNIQRLDNGNYLFGSSYYNALTVIESGDKNNPGSGGNSGAVSKTGATGNFQFTKRTARQYGLITKDGRDLRKDPAASFAAVQKLTTDNEKFLRKNGINPEPFMLYLAHQQGAGGALEIIKAAASGREVSAEVRSNMNHNNGAGKTPAQFLEYFKSRFNKIYNYFEDQTGRAVVEPELQAVLPNKPVEKVGLDKVLSAVPTAADHAISGQGDYEVPGKEVSNKKMDVDRLAALDYTFIPEKVDNVPTNVRNAVKGILVSV